MKRSLCAIGAGLAACASANAAFHLIFIQEVYVNCLNPNIQYVELVAWNGGQNFVAGHSVIQLNAAGTQVASTPCSSNVSNGANQMRILFATSEAATYFGITPDFIMPANLSLAGGKVLWDSLDAFSWGNYSGAAGTGGAGSGAIFSATGLGTQGYKKSATRRSNISGSPSVYDFADDTGSSANDFVFADANPRNNHDVSVNIPARSCPGDTNFDRHVDFTDLNNLLSDFGLSGTCLKGDVDDSGACDFPDLNSVLTAFGTNC